MTQTKVTVSGPPPHVAPSPPSLKIFWLRLWAPTSFSGLGPKSKSRCGSNFGFYIVIIKTVAFKAISQILVAFKPTLNKIPVSKNGTLFIH